MHFRRAALLFSEATSRPMTQYHRQSDLQTNRMSTTTPTGLQSMAELGRRRRLVIALNVVTYLAMMWVACAVLGAGGWTLVDIDHVRLLRARPAVDRARLLELGDRPVAAALGRQADGAGRALCGGRRRADADHDQHRDPDDAAQRGPRARLPPAAHREGQRRRHRLRRQVQLFHPVRHQRRRGRRGRGSRRRGLEARGSVRPTPPASSIAAAPTTPASRPATCATSATAGAATTS